VGRHSIPDPEESSRGLPDGASDETESFEQRPQVPPYDHGHRQGRRQPEYGGQDFDSEYDAEYESDYDDEYDEQDDSDVPDYLQRGYRDPERPRREYPDSAQAPSYAAAPPPRRAQHSGDWEGGEWTGSHRAIQPGRRGVSLGVIGALVAVVVVVAAFILWRFFGDALSDRSTLASARCVEGQQGVAVLTDPSIAEEIGKLGKKFNETANPSATRAWRSTSNPPNPIRWSTASSATGPPRSATDRRSGFPAARCRKPALKRWPASRPSTTPARLSAHLSF
jgi:hypothetical protein